MSTHFIEPLDVLFLRGNRLFGDAGSYGESLVPPWPSAGAGAVRSAILARDDVDFASYAKGEINHATLGTPTQPASFRLIDFQLAWHGPEGEDALQCLYPLPADLVAATDDQGNFHLNQIKPWKMSSGIECSIAADQLPVMSQAQRNKPASGYWLTSSGMQKWINGDLPDSEKDLVRSDRLWLNDERIGIGLDQKSRSVSEGKLFSMQAVAMHKGVGFVIDTLDDELDDGAMVRLGGDGRAAAVHKVPSDALTADLEAICQVGICRIVLTTPGIFTEGWRLPGTDDNGNFALGGISARVRSAAVPGAETISGWDLAKWQPKAAQKAAPAGSVYWLEDLQATPEQLRKLADHGLWPDAGYDAQRRTEGFNRFIFAN